MYIEIVYIFPKISKFQYSCTVNRKVEANDLAHTLQTG